MRATADFRADLDAAKYPDAELAALYRRRWTVETSFRDIETTLGLDVLRCRTPALIEKEVCLQAIAYNLIRALMLEAAWTHGVDLARLGFKGAVDTLRQWALLFATGPGLTCRSARTLACHRRRPRARASQPQRTARPQTPAQAVCVAYRSASPDGRCSFPKSKMTSDYLSAIRVRPHFSAEIREDARFRSSPAASRS